MYIQTHTAHGCASCAARCVMRAQFMRVRSARECNEARSDIRSSETAHGGARDVNDRKHVACAHLCSLRYLPNQTLSGDACGGGSASDRSPLVLLRCSAGSREAKSKTTSSSEWKSHRTRPPREFFDDLSEDFMPQRARLRLTREPPSAATLN